MKVAPPRRVSVDDSCLPNPPVSAPLLRRWHSADYIEHMRISSSTFSSEAVGGRIQSLPDIEAMRLRIAKRRELDTVLAREIYSARSLFDHRDLPEHVPADLTTFKLRLTRYFVLAQHYFAFLQLGVLVALIWANADWDSYTEFCLSSDPHALNFHFFINDVFMALFFGIAVVHVTTALLPGGSLFPLPKAITPLLGTFGGVIGPALIYLALVALQGSFATQSQGWAICIATDISIAWLLATQVFGSGSHPAVQFLLLLAVVDDIIGLVVIAIAFPTGDMHPLWLLLLLGSFFVSVVLRWVVKKPNWELYVLLPGPIAWFGLYKAGVHPSLALCFVVPFIPRSNLEKFDHQCSSLVHVGLFFFALSNAGVAFTGIGLVTLNVALSLVVGKTAGIFVFTYLGIKSFSLRLPDGLSLRHLGILAHLSGVGLTVALFVSELAFDDRTLQDEAKLGALLSVIVAPSAIIIGKLSEASRVTIVQPKPDSDLLTDV